MHSGAAAAASTAVSSWEALETRTSKPSRRQNVESEIVCCLFVIGLSFCASVSVFIISLFYFYLSISLSLFFILSFFSLFLSISLFISLFLFLSLFSRRSSCMFVCHRRLTCHPVKRAVENHEKQGQAADQLVSECSHHLGAGLSNKKVLPLLFACVWNVCVFVFRPSFLRVVKWDWTLL